jgi:hypothetical protein
MTGCTRTAPIDQLLDERTAVGSGNSYGLLLEEGLEPANICPFAAELGLQLRLERKRSETSTISLTALSQNVTVNAASRPSGAATGLRYLCARGQFDVSSEPHVMNDR